MEFFPPIDVGPDGFRSQTWDVRVASEVPADVDTLGSEVQAVVFEGLVDAFAAHGVQRREPVRVSCRTTDMNRLAVVVEVKSDHPDWQMGAIAATLQEIDRRLQTTHLQDRPRAQIPPWYLSPSSAASG